ncbi:hypothetical protein PGB90_001061 [Kerria lacca]
MSSLNIEVLQKASLISVEELIAIFGEFYPHLMNSLKAENGENRLDAISLVQRFFGRLDLNFNSYAFTQISDAVRDLDQLFNENISKVEQLLSAKINESCEYNKIIEFLNQNFCILISFESLIKHLNSRSLNIEDVDCVIKSTILILSTTFQHCRKNKNVYTEITNAVNEYITKLFIKCTELQIHFLEFLNNLKIDCNCEKQLQLLITVLYKVFDIGTVVSNLDLKTMAQLWKGFTTLIKLYSPYLKDEFDISKVIRFFFNEINEKIFSLCNIDNKLRTVTLKILCFLLKIVVKLCEYFVENLRNSYSDLFELILCLYQHSSFCVKVNNVIVEIATEVEKCLLPAIDPLIAALINDRAFVNYFLSINLENKNSGYLISVLLFITEILQKLIISSSEVRSLWIECCIFEFVLKLVSVSRNELCYELNLHVSCFNTSLSQEIPLYDGLIVYLSGLIIASLSCEKFYDFEQLLLSYLLEEGPLLIKIFVSDLWCTIIRYGNSDLCYEHTLYLINLFNVIHKEKIEIVFLISLIKRFFTFLSQNQQQLIMEIINDHDLFIELCNYTNVQIDTRLGIVNSSLQEITKKQNESLSNELPDISTMKSVALLCSANAVENTLNVWISNFLMKCWNELSRSNVRDLSVFKYFLIYLCELSHIYNTQQTNILCYIEELIHTDAIFVKLYTLKYFRNLAHYVIKENDVNGFIHTLGSLFKILLKDKNVIVHQEALESFSYFSHITKYEKIIQTAIANEPALIENVSLFLQKQPRKLKIERKFEEFLKKLSQTCSTQRIYQNVSPQIDSTCDEDPHEEKKNIKKIKLNSNFDDEIHKIETDAIKLLHDINACELTTKQKQKLRKMLNTVNKFQSYL